MLTVSPRCLGSTIALLLFAGSVPALAGAQTPAAPAAKPAVPSSASPLRAALDGILQGLKASPGCLGHQVAQTQDGKGVILAWFQNKKATVDWYYSPTHTRLMGAMQSPTRPPLEMVKDENIPVLVIASLTPAQRPDPGQKMPIAQIAIELYTPLPGGFAYGGRLAPETVKVPGLQSSPRRVAAPAPPTAAPPATPAP